MISPAQREKARKLVAKHRGIGPESISDQSIDLALMSGEILLSECGPADSGVNSYSAPLDTSSSTSYDSGSSYTGDSGSYSAGSGCDS